MNGGIDGNKIDDERAAINDELFEKICFTRTQNEKKTCSILD